jgi:hypothetical protein
MTTRKKAFVRALIIVVLLSLATTARAADDKSYSGVVKHLKTSYRAKQQGFFGMMMLARFAVKLIKPAGVKNFKVTMLRDLDFSNGPAPNSSEFHTAVRSRVNPVWEPLLQYSAPRQRQWSYAYVTREKKDVKVLIVAVQQREAFVVQFKFSPEKLIAFMNDPKIMGISLKGDNERNNQPPEADYEDDDDDDEEKSGPQKAKPPVSKPPE